MTTYKRVSNSTGSALMTRPGRLILWTDDKFCPVCRQRMVFGTDYRKQFSVDHIVPCIKGGNDMDQDPLGLCRACNSAKCSKSLKTFLKDRLTVLKRRRSIKAIDALAASLIQRAEAATALLASHGLDKRGRKVAA